MGHVARVISAAGWRKFSDPEGDQSRISSSEPREPVCIKTIRIIQEARRKDGGERGTSLSLLLCVTRWFLATDARDRVFALIGLARNNGAISVQPDYSKTTSEGYRDVTGQLIVQEQSFSLLTLVEDISQCDKEHSLPSWCPDYSSPQRLQRLVIFGYPMGRIRYSAAGLMTASTRCEPGSPVLTVKGHLADEIQTVSTSSFSDVRKHSEVMLNWLNLASLLLGKGSITIDAFWRTLIGNSDRNTFPVSQEYETHFFNYLSSTKKSKGIEIKSSIMDMVYRNLGGREHMPPESKDQLSKEESSSLYHSSFEYMSWQKIAFTTRGGRIGIGPPSMQTGDKVYIFSGSKVPFIIRKGSGQFHYRVIREAYVHGIMRGQAVNGNVNFMDVHLE